MLSLFKSRTNVPDQTADLSTADPGALAAQSLAEPDVAASSRERSLEDALLALAEYFEAGQADLTRPFALGADDPAVRRTEAAVQGFLGTVRSVRLDLEQMTAAASVTAAKGGHGMRTTAGHITDAHQQLEQAVTGIAQSQTGVSEVARFASNAAALADQAGTVTTQGAAVIQGAIGAVARIQEQIEQAQRTIAALAEQSERIERVSQVIEGIAKKTNLLSLNAAIEAARAGEQGRGFAVVASEVRNLADSTSRQTSEIRQLVSAVAADLKQAQEAIQGARTEADQGVALAGEAGSALGQIQALVSQTSAPLMEIAGLAEEQSAAMEQAAENLQDVTRRLGSVSEQAEAVAGLTAGLTGMTESAFSSLSRLECGSMIDEAHVAARTIAGEVSAVLTEVVDQGRATLDDLMTFTYTEYKGGLVDKLKGLWGDVSRTPRDGFTPPKYATAYDTLVDVPLMQMLDRYKETYTGLRFIVLSDLNGYSPAQNSQYCQPWTGDQKTDFHSRVKRMNCDEAQVRASRMGLDWEEKVPLTTGQADVRDMRTVHSRKEFLAAGVDLREPEGGDHSVLMQTFTRHTGTIVNILSVPLYVKGQRYGAIIVGWLPEQ
jgi:methyl-accepting chemotaxis protein